MSSVAMDDWEVLAKAEHRDAELNANPSLGLDFDETIEAIRIRRRIATMQPSRNIAMKVPAAEFAATVALPLWLFMKRPSVSAW